MTRNEAMVELYRRGYTTKLGEPNETPLYHNPDTGTPYTLDEACTIEQIDVEASGLDPPEKEGCPPVSPSCALKGRQPSNDKMGASFDTVNHPPHYGGDNPYEAIKVVEAWELGFHLGNTVKYIARAGKKGDRIEDLKKASWYLNREIERLEKGK